MAILAEPIEGPLRARVVNFENTYGVAVLTDPTDPALTNYGITFPVGIGWSGELRPVVGQEIFLSNIWPDRVYGCKAQNASPISLWIWRL
jgi:hypothetical protein